MSRSFVLKRWEGERKNIMQTYVRLFSFFSSFSSTPSFSDWCVKAGLSHLSPVQAEVLWDTSKHMWLVWNVDFGNVSPGCLATAAKLEWSNKQCSRPRFSKVPYVISLFTQDFLCDFRLSHLQFCHLKRLTTFKCKWVKKLNELLKKLTLEI